MNIQVRGGGGNRQGPQRRRGPMGGGGPPGSQQVEKAKDAKGALVKLLKLLIPHKILVAFIVLMAIVSTVFTIYSPMVMKDFVNEIFTGVMSQFTHDMAEDIKAGDFSGVTDSINQLLNRDLTETQVKKIFVYIQMSGTDMQSLMSDMSADDLTDFFEEADKIDLTPEMLMMFENMGNMTAGTEPEAEEKEESYGIDFSVLGKLAVLLICLYLISFVFSYMQQRLMAIITQKTMFELRNKVNEKLSRMPLSYFDQTSRGEIMSRMTNDIDNISMTLQQNLTQMITAATTIVGILIMMFSINVMMTFLSLATIPVCMIILMLIMSRSRKYFAKQWEITGDLNGHIEEMYTGHNIVKAFSREKNALKDFKEMNENLFKTGRKAQFLSGIIFPLLGFINNIGYVIICVAGGILAIDGKLLPGDIQAMIQYSRNLTQQINQSSNIINTIQSALASAERVFNLIAEPEEIPETITENLAPVNNEVEFESVEFYYSEDKPLIGNMNLKVEPGEMVAIVGPTGAGKTTLVNLLMRFYDVQNGAIKVNDVDIRHVARKDLRNIFGMVLQDTWLFSGTIYDNIAYGRENSGKEEIYAAAKAARADHFIDTLPDGYNTILDEEGSNISQGQRQLLTIARAINANHEILILDEATSSVDTRTEILIQKAMTVLMKGKTSFVIAHRLSTIRDADTILVMNNGDIIEQGSHTELLEKGGFYSDLYHSQFAT
ncbi:MAG: ABC transporter ATP-binding protein/permease [Oscillospiraceae bacterium]|nr:ABC transporter ATP-binding protein/permease [Oscillospiraceae bacterium]